MGIMNIYDLKKMKHVRIIYMLSFALIYFNTSAIAQNVLDDTTKNKIKNVIDNPVKVYPLSMTDKDIIYKNIDNWVNKQINLDKAKQSISENVTSYIFTVKMNKNQFDDEILQTYDQNYIVKYEKEPFKRTYWKELKIPSLTAMSESEVRSLCEKFVLSKNLIKTTDIDKIKDIEVHNRVRQRLDSIRTEKEILLQRAVFKRSVKEIDVMNSKIIVDVSPSSREILSFKSLIWTPVIEEKGDIKEYKSFDDVIGEINDIISQIPVPIKVRRTDLYYLQTLDLIVPVLRIKIEPVDENEVMPDLNQYIIYLLADESIIALPKRKDNIAPKNLETP